MLASLVCTYMPVVCQSRDVKISTAQSHAAAYHIFGAVNAFNDACRDMERAFRHG